MMYGDKEADYTPDQSTMKELRNRCPTDTKLRELGWRIHSRPKQGEPVWERNGKLRAQSLIIKELANGHNQNRAV